MFTSFSSEDTQLFSAAVTDVANETGVSEGTVRFTVSNGDNVNEEFDANVVEGQAFMDVGCNTESYGDVMVPLGNFTVEADYLGTSNFASSSDPVPSDLSCSNIVVE